MIADYDPSEPKYIPIIAAIFITLVLIFATAYGVLIYYKASISSEIKRQEQTHGSAIELKQLRTFETNYLNKKTNKKISIDDAIYIINRQYR